MLASSPPQVSVPSLHRLDERHAHGLLDVEDDLDVEDAIDPDLFPIFEEEAQELLPQLAQSLRRWSETPEASEPRLLSLRALHTLKGSARLAGAMRLGELAHRMESAIEQVPEHGLQRSQIEPLIGRFDVLQSLFERLRLPESVAPESDLSLEDQVSVPVVEEVASTSLVDLTEPAEAHAPEPASGLLPQGMPLTQIAQPAPLVTLATPRAASQAVRVRSQLLDRLVNQTGEVMMTRARLDGNVSQMRSSLADLHSNLERLRQQLRDIELQAEVQMQSRMAQAKDTHQVFDPLEFDRFTRVQELTRMMAESVSDVATVQRNLEKSIDASEADLVAQARQTRELQRDLLRTRMIEFDGISERLYRVVRQAAKEVGKQVRLDLKGGSIEMDRGVLDRMTPAFEHLLRNCVVHGIELPQDRQARDKDPVGTITIELRQEGNDVSVIFSDDGQGLDLARIRSKAQSLGLIAAEDELDAHQTAQLVFLPGLSTAAEVSELAGRGIGMDLVKAEVLALGGRVDITSEPGAGARIGLYLPLTTAVTQVVLLRVGGLVFGVPSNLVELVRRTGFDNLQAAYDTGRFDFNGEALSFFWAGHLLQAGAPTLVATDKTLSVVIFRSASQRVALHVDEVLGNQEVVVKNLGPQLSRLPGLTGMTALSSGSVVLIYNPVALAATYGEQLRASMAAGASLAQLPAEPMAPEPVADLSPLIMVVDDSITVRRVTQRLLVREGYRVVLASDGLQALERLQDERPQVVLSDIEMPRMDGFDLVRNIRSDESLRDLPVIMITSRIAEKHREHARELGVDHYLGKPYSEEELLRLLRQYTRPGAHAAGAIELVS